MLLPIHSLSLPLLFYFSSACWVCSCLGYLYIQYILYITKTYTFRVSRALSLRFYGHTLCLCVWEVRYSNFGVCKFELALLVFFRSFVLSKVFGVSKCLNLCFSKINTLGLCLVFCSIATRFCSISLIFITDHFNVKLAIKSYGHKKRNSGIR